MFGSHAMITADFQIAGIVGTTEPVHIYICKNGFDKQVTLSVMKHGVEPSRQYQATMNLNELIAFGELCITLGKLYLKKEGDR